MGKSLLCGPLSDLSYSYLFYLFCYCVSLCIHRTFTRRNDSPTLIKMDLHNLEMVVIAARKIGKMAADL